jgi:uncharacterized protein DUF6756
MDRNEMELRRAIEELHLSPQRAAVCDPALSAHVVERVKQTFVREPNSRWWWASLRKPGLTIDYPAGDAYCHLLEIVPSEATRCWFIVENDEDGPWHVLDADTEVVPSIIAECSHFEYYLVGRSFNWLIAENHHNQLVVAASR